MRVVTVGVLVLALACSTAACSSSHAKASKQNNAASVNVDAYLAVATQQLVPGDPLNVLAHFERAARDPSFHFDPSVVTPEAYAPTFTRMDSLDDTTDFDVLYMLNLLYAYGDELPVATRDAINAHLEKYKYWYTEPTPKGLVDNKYYWSENHRIIYYTDEYLAGSMLAGSTFTNDGRSALAHAEHGKQQILEWLDEKVRYGFTEWHSDVYYQKDIDPLLTLAEFAPDPNIANRATMVLDLFLLDIALHLQKGNFGATHGRSYMKDKSTATDQDTFGLSKLLFDDTSEPYPGGDPGATLFARAKKYVMPPVIRAIARDDQPMVDTEHMNVPLDANAPVTDNPVPPVDQPFDNLDSVPFWWERGAQTSWQVVPLTIKALDTYNLWDSQFYKPFKPLATLVRGDDAKARELAHSLAPVLGFGLLSEVHTYTYRDADTMLSTAQDYRPGMFGEQYHAWQATLDENAIVFTTHPKNEPQSNTQWPDDDGYWTGTGSMPRSAQYQTVSINIYAPQFTPPGPPLDTFGYLDYTHAYFPQEKFDEVVRDGHWTFGRKGNGYVALWSQAIPHWRTYPPSAHIFTHGLTKPFDLVAPGSPDNVWIAEVGSATTYGSFAEFRAKVGAAPVHVGADHSVAYTSPKQGRLTFGWHVPLAVDGKVTDLHPSDRMDNPFVHVPWEGRRYDVKLGAQSLTLDFDAWRRSTSS